MHEVPALEATIRETQPRSPRPEDPIRVLMIEDEFDIARLFMRRLHWSTRADFLVDHALSVNDGIAQLSRSDTDLILLDLCLPDAEGLETVRRVSGHASNTPIVVLSADEDEWMARATIREGVQDYLVKRDQDARSLVRAIVHSLERSKRSLAEPADLENLGAATG